MVKCKRMKRQLCMSKNWIYSWQWKSSRTRQQCYRLESFAMKTGIPTNGSMVKNHISLRKEFGLFATQRTSFLLWFQACQVRPLDLHQLQGHLWNRRVIPHHLLHPHLLHVQLGEMSVREREDAPNNDISPVPVSNSVDDRSGQPDETQVNKTPKPNKKETTIARGDPLCSDDPEIPECLQEFRENLVDDEIPIQGGSHASSSQEASLEPIYMRREELGKHNVHTHFPKDRNCEICKRTKITKAPCRRRNGGAVPRADNFGDLIRADHKVLSDNCESRNNHRYAVVVQDLATQWIQAYPCKNKNFTRNPEKLAKVPGAREETKSHLHWQFLGIRKSLWRSFMESLHVHTTQIGE